MQYARLRGVEFRATGTHPDNWVLEYDAGIALTFVAENRSSPCTNGCALRAE